MFNLALIFKIPFYLLYNWQGLQLIRITTNFSCLDFVFFLQIPLLERKLKHFTFVLHSQKIIVLLL